MGLKISNAVFTTEGVTIDINEMFVGIKLVMPDEANNPNAYITLSTWDNVNRVKRFYNVDFLNKKYVLEPDGDPLAMTGTDWYNKLISQLEEANPDWVGKITIELG